MTQEADIPTGRVVAIANGMATVVVDALPACRRCAAGRGCGAGVLAGGQRSRRLDVPVPPGARLCAGDRVRLTLRPRRLLQATLLAYGLPLAALLLVPLLANGLWGPWDDWQLALLAAGGLGGAIVAGRRFLSTDRCLDDLLPGIAGRAGAADVE